MGTWRRVAAYVALGLKGRVNKLRLMKCMGYGTAGFPFLRKPRPPRLVKRKEWDEPSPSQRRQASITKSVPELFHSNMDIQVVTPLPLSLRHPPARLLAIMA